MKVHPQDGPGLRNRKTWIAEKQSAKVKSEDGPISLFATSLRHQTTEFFNNSTLHGVRYIAEKERPFCEKCVDFNF